MGKVKTNAFFQHLIPEILGTLYTGVVDLIYPPLCLICDHRLEYASQQLCQDCLEKFKLIGKPHTAFSVSEEIFISSAWALFEFDEPFQQLIHHLKYSRRRKPMKVLLEYYEEEILTQLPQNAIDRVISIPLHPRKLRERGYNQVDDFTCWLADKLELAAGNHLVRRTKYTVSQTKLSACQRMENVSAAFALTAKADVEGQHILLVDDVLTTGATSNALARVLRAAGASRIDLITLSTPQFGNA